MLRDRVRTGNGFLNRLHIVFASFRATLEGLGNFKRTRNRQILKMKGNGIPSGKGRIDIIADITECYQRLKIVSRRLEIRNKWIQFAMRYNHCDRIDTARQLNIYDKSLVVYKRHILRKILNRWTRWYRWLHLLKALHARVWQATLKKAKDIKRSHCEVRERRRKAKVIERWTHIVSLLVALLKKGRVILAKKRHAEYVNALEKKRHFFGRWRYERDTRRFDSELMCRAILRLTLGPYARSVQHRCAVVIQKVVRGFLFRRRMAQMSRYMVLWKTRYQTVDALQTRGERLGKGYRVPDAEIELGSFSKIVNEPVLKKNVEGLEWREQHGDYEQFIDSAIQDMIKDSCDIDSRSFCINMTSSDVLPLSSLSQLVKPNEALENNLAFEIDLELEYGCAFANQLREINGFQAIGNVSGQTKEAEGVRYDVTFVGSHVNVDDFETSGNVIFISPVDQFNSITGFLSDFGASAKASDELTRNNNFLYVPELDFSGFHLELGLHHLNFERNILKCAVVPEESLPTVDVSVTRIICHHPTSPMRESSELFRLPFLERRIFSLPVPDLTKQKIIHNASKDCIDCGFSLHSNVSCELPLSQVIEVISAFQRLEINSVADLKCLLFNGTDHLLDASSLQIQAPTKDDLPLSFHMKSLSNMRYVLIPFVPTDKNIHSLIDNGLLPSLMNDLPIIYDYVNEDLCQEILHDILDCVLVETYHLNDSEETIDPLHRMTMTDTRVCLSRFNIDELISEYLTDSMDDMPIRGNDVTAKDLKEILKYDNQVCSLTEFATCDLSVLLSFLLVDHVEKMSDDEALIMATKGYMDLPIESNCVTTEPKEIIRGYDMFSYDFVMRSHSLRRPFDVYRMKDPESMVGHKLLDEMTKVMFPDLPIIENKMKEGTIDEITDSLALEESIDDIIDCQAEIDIEFLRIFEAMDMLGYINMRCVDRVMNEMMLDIPVEENDVCDEPYEIIEDIDLISTLELVFQPNTRLVEYIARDPTGISDWKTVEVVCEWILRENLEALPIQANVVSQPAINEIIRPMFPGACDLKPFDSIDIDNLMFYLQAPIPITKKLCGVIAFGALFEDHDDSLFNVDEFAGVDISDLETLNWRSLPIIPNRDVVKGLMEVLVFQQLSGLPIQLNDIDPFLAGDVVETLVSPACLEICCDVEPIRNFEGLDAVLPYDRGILDHTVACVFMDLIEKLPIVSNGVDDRLVQDILGGVNLSVADNIVSQRKTRPLERVTAKEVPIPVDEKFFNWLMDVILRENVLPVMPLEKADNFDDADDDDGDLASDEEGSVSDDPAQISSGGARQTNLLDDILDEAWDDFQAECSD